MAKKIGVGRKSGGQAAELGEPAEPAVAKLPTRAG